MTLRNLVPPPSLLHDIITPVVIAPICSRLYQELHVPSFQDITGGYMSFKLRVTVQQKTHPTRNQVHSDSCTRGCTLQYTLVLEQEGTNTTNYPHCPRRFQESHR